MIQAFKGPVEKDGFTGNAASARFVAKDMPGYRTGTIGTPKGKKDEYDIALNNVDTALKAFETEGCVDHIEGEEADIQQKKDELGGFVTEITNELNDIGVLIDSTSGVVVNRQMMSADPQGLKQKFIDLRSKIGRTIGVETVRIGTLQKIHDDMTTLR
ncbi:hypothetical protein, conserved, partial [Babesia bigemina]